MSFESCIPIILSSEGGYVDNPRDPGGPTNRGITLATLSAFLGHIARVADVQALTQTTAETIYRNNYYNPAHGPDLPNGVDLMVFDTAVNSGVGAAIRLLQQALGGVVDGHFGPQTLAAVEAADRIALINRFHDVHEHFYQLLPTYAIFGRGWSTRNDRTRTLALGMT